jgi:hypothetical protein
MARPGRKRSNNPRYSSGRVVNSAERESVNRRDLAEFQPHRRGLPEAQRLDQRAESLLGRLNLRGDLTDQQYDAGKQFSAIVVAYLAVIDAPNPFASAGDGTRGRSVLGDDECARRKERYDRAYEALWSAGQRPTRAVSSIAVHDREINLDLIYLTNGLDKLSEHFGYTRRTKARVIPFSAFEATL